MMRTHGLWLGRLALGLGAFQPPAAAQKAKPGTPARPHVELEFTADPDLLAERLKTSGQLENPIKRMAEQVRKNPEPYKELLKSFDLNDPNLKRRLERDPFIKDVLKNLAEDEKKAPQDFKAIQDLIKKEQIEVPKDFNV